MKFSLSATLFLLLSSTVTSRVVPDSDVALLKEREASSLPADIPSGFSDLEKRRGGGGGGRGGGGSSSSGGGSGGKSGSGGSTSPTKGGTSSGGSGTPRTFGGGSFYPGGAKTPYQAGKASPKGLAPAGLLPIGALAFFPGAWLYGAHMYPFHHSYHYRNHTNNDRNESLPIKCLCQEYSVCGCEDNNNGTYLDSLVNGTTSEGLPRNNSIIKVAKVNGTRTLFINGTLSNDTTAPSSGSSQTLPPPFLSLGGYWVMAAVVVGTVWLV